MNPRPKVVLYLDHTAALGGGEIALLHLVQALDRRRYFPLVVLSSEGPLRDKMLELGVETHVIPLADSIVQARKDTLDRSSLTRLRDFKRMLSYCRRLAIFMRRRRVDIVHTNSLKADIIGGIAAHLAHKPLIWHIHDRIETDYLPPKVVRGFRLLCRILPHHVIAVSRATLETLRLPPQQQATVVYNGVLSETILPNALGDNASPADQRLTSQSPKQPLKGNQSLEEHHSLVGVVGRLSPWKGQHIFIQAAAILKQNFPDVKYQIIGSALFGEEAYEREIRQLVIALDLEGDIEFTGFREDVSEMIRNLDILVHASTTGEPFGKVVIEGMAAGKPVVATNGGGVPEIVQHGTTGLLVPMDDAPAMAQALIELLSDPQGAQKMGQMGCQHVLENFTIEHTARKVESIYELLASNRARHPKRRPAGSSRA